MLPLTLPLSPAGRRGMRGVERWERIAQNNDEYGNGGSRLPDLRRVERRTPSPGRIFPNGPVLLMSIHLSQSSSHDGISSSFLSTVSPGRRGLH
jgi:hypothetical protein